MLSSTATTALLAILESVEPDALDDVDDLRVILEPLPGRTVAAMAHLGGELLLVLDPAEEDAPVHGLALLHDLIRDELRGRLAS